MNQQAERYFFKLGDDGCVQGPKEKTLYASFGSSIRLIVRSRDKTLIPYVLLRKNYKGKKSTATISESLKHELFGHKIADIQLPLKLERKALNEILRVQELELDEQGDWYHEFCFTEHNMTGSVFFRLLWAKDRNSSEVEIDHLSEPNYIILQPRISEELTKITIQTVLPFSLGKFDQWESQIRSQEQIGYRGFHLPPIQQLGESGSLYSVADQLQLNKELFPTGKSEKDLKNLFSRFPKCFFFIDILLNHTAFDSEWLNQSGFESAVYNQKTTPALSCAIELDQAIGRFSNDLGNKKVEQYQKKNVIENEQDLNKIMEILENQVKQQIKNFGINQIIRPLRLQEYFQFEIPRVIKELERQIGFDKIPRLEKDINEEDEDENIFRKSPRQVVIDLVRQNVIEKGHARFGMTLKFEPLVNYLKQSEFNKLINDLVCKAITGS